MEISNYNVTVYKTDVKSTKVAEVIIAAITKYYPNHIVFFDLRQRDKLLWVEGWNTRNLIIQDTLIQLGYHCEVFRD